MKEGRKRGKEGGRKGKEREMERGKEFICSIICRMTACHVLGGLAITQNYQNLVLSSVHKLCGYWPF